MHILIIPPERRFCRSAAERRCADSGRSETVLAFKLLRHEKIELLLPDGTLLQYEMKKLNAKGGTCFFLGSSEGTLQKIKAKAAGLYPNIRIDLFPTSIKRNSPKRITAG